MNILIVALALSFHGGIFASPSFLPRDKSSQTFSLKRSPAESFKEKPGIFLDAPLVNPPENPSATLSSVRYGPFALRAGGMVADKKLRDVEKPCTDCYIVAIQSRLEDTSRKEQYTASGLWLHHVIFFNTAQVDLTCPRMAGERFYGGGNTKATRRWNHHGRWGYYVGEDHEWHMVVDLMNYGTTDIDAVVRVDFEWVSASSAEGSKHRPVRPIWLALDDFCGDSGMPVPSLTEPFRFTTPKWTSTVDGPLVDVAAHMHDGGIEMLTYQNGQAICRSVQLYSQDQESHIIGQGACKDASRVKKGDVLTAEVIYEPAKHALVMHDGQPDWIMGSDGVYVGIE